MQHQNPIASYDQKNYRERSRGDQDYDASFFKKSKPIECFELTQCPPEIINIIMHYLSFQELFNLAATSKRLNNMARKHNRTFTYISYLMKNKNMGDSHVGKFSDIQDLLHSQYELELKANNYRWHKDFYEANCPMTLLTRMYVLGITGLVINGYINSTALHCLSSALTVPFPIAQIWKLAVTSEDSIIRTYPTRKKEIEENKFKIVVK